MTEVKDGVVESYFMRVIVPAMNSNKTARKLLMQNQVLQSESYCCGEAIRLQIGSVSSCDCCRSTMSPEDGSVLRLQQFKDVDYRRLVIILWRLSHASFSMCDIAAESGLTTQVVSDIIKVFSSKIKDWMETCGHTKLGGIGYTTELDETELGNRKHGKGKEKRKATIFGIIERRTGRSKTSVVPNTRKKTLVPIILRTVRKGSRIMSDGHKTYQKLDSTYNHLYVNHSKTYVIHLKGTLIHTNRIEGSWKWFKNSVKTKRDLEDACTWFDFRNVAKGDFQTPAARMRSTFVTLMKVIKTC